MHSGLTNFQAMYAFVADEVALSSDRRQLDCLPTQSRAKLLAVTAAFVPYYNHSAVRVVLLHSQCSRQNLRAFWQKVLPPGRTLGRTPSTLLLEPGRPAMGIFSGAAVLPGGCVACKRSK